MACDDPDTKPPKTSAQTAKGNLADPKILDDIFSRGATDEQIAALREAVAAHKTAQAALMDAAGVLWNSQVDAAMAIGGPHGASIAMAQRLNFFDNCSCSPCPIVIHCW